MKIIKRAITVLMLSIMTIQLCACGASSGLNTDIDSNDNINSTDDTNMDWKQYQGVWVRDDSGLQSQRVSLTIIDDTGLIKRWYIEIIDNSVSCIYSNSVGQILSNDEYVQSLIRTTGDDGKLFSLPVDQPIKKHIGIDDTTSTVTGLIMDGEIYEPYYPLDSFSSWKQSGLMDLIEDFIDRVNTAEAQQIDINSVEDLYGDSNSSEKDSSSNQTIEQDANGNGIPDSEEDLNNNGIPDSQEGIETHNTDSSASDEERDKNHNGIADVYEFSTWSTDGDGTSVSPTDVNE